MGQVATAKKTVQSGGRRQAKRPLVGLFIASEGPYTEQVVQAIAQYARAHTEWRIGMAGFGDVDLHDIGDGRVAGVIVGPWAERPPLIKAIQKAGIPAVDMAAGAEGSSLPTVLPDDFMVGRHAAEHLLFRGFRNFGFVGLPASFNAYWADRRRDGFVSALESHGMASAVFEGSAKGWTRLNDARNIDELRRWLVRLPKPVGVLAAFDTLAYELLSQARESGVVVPQDLAVIGVDNREWICTLANPTITSIPLDGHSAGTSAAQVLARSLADRKAPIEPMLIAPLAIQSRESTDAFAFSDALVVEALRFIRNQSHKPISVEDILDELLVSRRLLEIRFKKATGRTLQAEIWRTHLEKARTLLVETSGPISAIIEGSGFRSSAVFNVMFRRATGLTPTQFRNQHKRRDR
ncbi:MAG: substrate-binding domain-containing protein [Phycisphaerales bacterium]|nr:substrate-binding domain-containing protein [Phycisphaerales bacterium]